MTFSKYTDEIVRTDKYGSRNGKSVEYFVVHHTGGGTNASNLYELTKGSRRVSASYLNYTTGHLVGMVDEENRPWTTGVKAVDEKAVTIENVNTTGAPTWRVSDKQIEVLIKLSAELAHRHKWGRVDRNRVRGHREFAATLCPGDYLYGMLDEIAVEANRLIGSPSSGGGNVPSIDLSGISKLIDDIIIGKYGNDPHRRQRLIELGFSSAEVKSIYNAVADRMRGRSTSASVEELKYLSSIIDGIIAGKYGNGAVRVQRLINLGFTEDEVNRLQLAVNERLKKR